MSAVTEWTPGLEGLEEDPGALLSHSHLDQILIEDRLGDMTARIDAAYAGRNAEEESEPLAMGNGTGPDRFVRRDETTTGFTDRFEAVNSYAAAPPVEISPARSPVDSPGRRSPNMRAASPAPTPPPFKKSFSKSYNGIKTFNHTVSRTSSHVSVGSRSGSFSGANGDISLHGRRGEISVHGVSSSVCLMDSNSQDHSSPFKTPQELRNDLLPATSPPPQYTPLDYYYHTAADTSLPSGRPDSPSGKRTLFAGSILARPNKRKPRPILRSPENSVHGLPAPPAPEGAGAAERSQEHEQEQEHEHAHEHHANTATFDKYKASLALRPRKNVRFALQQPWTGFRVTPAMCKENDRLVQVRDLRERGRGGRGGKRGGGREGRERQSERQRHTDRQRKKEKEYVCVYE